MSTGHHPRDLSPGSTLGPYQVLARLGRGGMGSVYRARNVQGQEVALKVIASDDAADPTFVERFRREAAAAASVAHPGVARCLDSGEANGRIFMALELVPGGTLSERIHRAGRLSWRDAVQVAIELASALEAVHAAGLVHRDLKPQNILIDAVGRTRITDFGVARGVAAANALTRTGEVLGSAEYMAPEQAGSPRDVDARADLYALGMIVHALISGQPPFRGTLLSVLQRKLSEAPPRLRASDPAVPAALDDLVHALTSPAPDDRPKTARAVREALEAVAGEKDRVAPSGQRAFAAIALAALAAAGIGAAVVTTHRPATTPDEGGSPTSTTTTATPPTTPTNPKSPRPSASGTPAWYEKRVAAKLAHAPLPLPKAITFGAEDGEYELVHDRSVKLVYVPGGEFDMGGDDAEAELDNQRPIHPVRVSSFFMGKYEITTAQFRKWVNTWPLPETLPPGERTGHGRSAPLTWQNPWEDGHPAGDNDPVVQVSPSHALRYAAWAEVDLPTEAEWEYAASWNPTREPGHRKQRFTWGDAVPGQDSHKYANLLDSSIAALEHGEIAFPNYKDDFAYIAPVGSFPEDRSYFGVYDMTGNVREVCKDLYDPSYYTRFDRTKVLDDPVNLTPSSFGPESHSERGGSWGAHDGRYSLAVRYDVSTPRDVSGFRIALSEKR